MIRGPIDDHGRAFLEIALIARSAAELPLQAWVDTGFTGEIVISRRLAEELGFDRSGAITAELGDGNEVLLPTYSCHVRWLSATVTVEAIASISEIPLVGIGLLRGRRLVVDFGESEVTLE